MAIKHIYRSEMKELLRLMLKLREEGPEEVRYGICFHVNGNHEEKITRWFYEAFMSWPEFTGNIVYPVPHPDYEDEMAGYHATADVWKGEYGEARMRLLDHLILKAGKDLSDMIHESKEEISLA